MEHPSFEDFYDRHDALSVDKAAAFVEGDIAGTEQALNRLNELHRDHPEHSDKAWQRSLDTIIRQRKAREDLKEI